jgi:hypothetical protein
MVERILEQRGVAVVVLCGDDDVAVRLVDPLGPAPDVRRVLAPAVGRRDRLVVERQR